MEKGGYDMLANAIVIRAADDYRKASKGKLTRAKKTEMKEIEGFLLSSWFTSLTEVDGRYILRKLNEEVMKR